MDNTLKVDDGKETRRNSSTGYQSERDDAYERGSVGDGGRGDI